MRKNIFIILLLSLGIFVTGCGKKQEPITEMQEPISIEELGNLSASTSAQITPEAAPQTLASPQIEAGLEKLPPAGPYKPTNQEIQAALKNAGCYTALIDGKIGPQTKKAVEDFQQANNLKVDGKVGPKTWEVLSKYLNPQLQPATKTPPKR